MDKQSDLLKKNTIALGPRKKISHPILCITACAACNNMLFLGKLISLPAALKLSNAQNAQINLGVVADYVTVPGMQKCHESLSLQVLIPLHH